MTNVVQSDLFDHETYIAPRIQPELFQRLISLEPGRRVPIMLAASIETLEAAILDLEKQPESPKTKQRIRTLVDAARKKRQYLCKNFQPGMTVRILNHYVRRIIGQIGTVLQPSQEPGLDAFVRVTTGKDSHCLCPPEHLEIVIPDAPPTPIPLDLRRAMPVLDVVAIYHGRAFYSLPKSGIYHRATDAALNMLRRGDRIAEERYEFEFWEHGDGDEILAKFIGQPFLTRLRHDEIQLPGAIPPELETTSIDAGATPNDQSIPPEPKPGDLICLSILLIDKRQHYYQAPSLRSYEIASATPSQLRLVGHANIHKHRAFCLRSEADERAAVECHARYQAALNALADHLKRLGCYADQLAAAGGLKIAPNPLTPWCFTAPDPNRDRVRDFNLPWQVFPLNPERCPVFSHTPKMIRSQRQCGTETYESIHSQDDYFGCDDQGWATYLQLWQAASAAATDLEHCLKFQLQSYAAAESTGAIALEPPTQKIPLIDVAPIESTPPELSRRAELLAQINMIRSTGPVAPHGCWMEKETVRKKLVGGEIKRYEYFRIKAYEPIFEGKGKKTRSIHLGDDQALNDWGDRLSRRRAINALEKEIDQIERQIQNR